MEKVARKEALKKQEEEEAAMAIARGEKVVLKKKKKATVNSLDMLDAGLQKGKKKSGKK